MIVLPYLIHSFLILHFLDCFLCQHNSHTKTCNNTHRHINEPIPNPKQLKSNPNPTYVNPLNIIQIRIQNIGYPIPIFIFSTYLALKQITISHAVSRPKDTIPIYYRLIIKIRSGLLRSGTGSRRRIRRQTEEQRTREKPYISAPDRP